MEIIVGVSDLESVVYHGSVVRVTGTNQETGDTVTFVGDARATGAFLDVVEAEGEATAWVEDYQVWRVVKA